MNFVMNHGLIFLNTASTPQNIVLIIVEKHILMIWNVSEKSSSNSTSVHILHHHFRGGWGSRAMMMLMTQRGVGGPKLAQSWWCNMCTLPNHLYYPRHWPGYTAVQHQPSLLVFWSLVAWASWAPASPGSWGSCTGRRRSSSQTSSSQGTRSWPRGHSCLQMFWTSNVFKKSWWTRGLTGWSTSVPSCPLWGRTTSPWQWGSTLRASTMW